MLTVYQTTFNNEETGERGNCLASSIASLIECDINLVPQDNYLSQALLDFIFTCGYGLELIYEEEDIPKDEYYIAVGKSPRDINLHHSVIFQNGNLYHDPYGFYTEANNTLGILTEEYFIRLNKL